MTIASQNRELATPTEIIDAAPSQASHIDTLDGLRAVAALIIVISHTSNRYSYELTGFGAGQIGVMIFFALSGFLMAHITQDKPPTKRNIWNFFVHRFSRVIPLYLFVVFFSYICNKIGIGGDSISFYGIRNEAILLKHLTFSLGNSVLWTISIELLFYIIYPAFWFLLWRGRSLPYIILPSMLATFAISLALFGHSFRDEIYNYSSDFHASVRLFAHGHYFLLGIVVYALSRHAIVRESIANILLISSIVLVGISFPGVYFALFGLDINIWYDIGAALAIFTLLYTVQFSNYAKYAFGNSAARYIGAISYSIYLTHVVVISAFWTTNLKENWMLFVGVEFILIIIVASVTYFAVERPSRYLINALFSRRSLDEVKHGFGAT